MSMLPLPTTSHQTQACASADSNIALVKYWGKRDPVLNLPMNSSLSLSLNGLGTQTTISIDQQDAFSLNGQPDEKAKQRLFRWIDRLTMSNRPKLFIASHNSIPTAAGLASSASGFAAAALCLNQLFGWSLTLAQLSGLARLGSGSASRSLMKGFVIWHKGERADGSDSMAERLPEQWPDLMLGILPLSTSPKSIGSTQGMINTLETSPLYAAWPTYAEQTIPLLIKAIQAQDLAQMGALLEHNAMTMHATMLSAWPAVNYWQPSTIQAMHKVLQLRHQGIPVFYTMDAGPNLKLLCLKPHLPTVMSIFPELIPTYPFPHE